ncbi:rhomboid family intramembrane serine protease [Candidatus Bathyarchaeota archaeon]|nr:rhomboid family intramembrane serine protease [Candidatus Bathyarchaeota archaeon]
MLPIRDLNRSVTTPHVNRLLLIANILIFVVYWLSAENIFLDSRFAAVIEQRFIMFPYEIIEGVNYYTLFTSMFMHANWFHLFSNMLFLFIFGDNIEDAMGHFSYLGFYLVCGLAAAFAHISSIVFGLPNSGSLLEGVVGASGAISGVLGAYFVLYPKARVLTFVSFVILPIPALFFLGFWFVMQWLSVYFDVSGGIAYWAHIGGFVAGAVLGLTFGRWRKKQREALFRL